MISVVVVAFLLALHVRFTRDRAIWRALEAAQCQAIVRAESEARQEAIRKRNDGTICELVWAPTPGQIALEYHCALSERYRAAMWRPWILLTRCPRYGEFEVPAQTEAF
jgi:hypothetical protein